MKVRLAFISIFSFLLLAFSFTNAYAAYRLKKTIQPYNPIFITNSVKRTSSDAFNDAEAISHGKGGHGHGHSHSSGHHYYAGSHSHHSTYHGRHYSSHYHNLYYNYSHAARSHYPRETDWAATSIFFDVLGLIPIYVFSVIGIISGLIGMAQGRRPTLSRAGVIIGIAEVVIITVLLLIFA